MEPAFRIGLATTAADRRRAAAIRHAVFVVEQGIPEHLDRDGLDDGATHVLGWWGDRAVATGRLVTEPEATGHLGRIAVLPDFRGRGLGRRVVAALETAARAQGLHTALLHAHSHLEAFYRALGYRPAGLPFDAGGYRLIPMKKTL